MPDTIVAPGAQTAVRLGAPSRPPTLALLTDSAELDRLEPQWRYLLGRSSADELMLTPTWLLTWWSLFGSHDGRQLRVAQFHEGTRLVGVAPLLARRSWHRGVIPFRRLEWLASGEPPADSICSDYLNLIAERGSEERIALTLVQGITEGVFGPCDEVVLPMMNGEHPLPQLLADTFRAHGWQAEIVETARSPYIALPATWDEYMQQLSGNTRSFLRRSQRDFDKWAEGTASFERAATIADLAEGTRILIDLHHQRWQSPKVGGVFRSPHFLAFHERVMRELLEQGKLELSWLRVRGEPVAALYNVVHANKVYYYQAGRKLDVPKNVRPGIVLMAHAIRAAIEAGRREFDFLAGDSQYKSQLATASRPIVQVRAARLGIRETARAMMESGIERLRRVRSWWLRIWSTTTSRFQAHQCRSNREVVVDHILSQRATGF